MHVCAACMDVSRLTTHVNFNREAPWDADKVNVNTLDDWKLSNHQITHVPQTWKDAEQQHHSAQQQMKFRKHVRKIKIQTLTLSNVSCFSQTFRMFRWLDLLCCRSDCACLGCGGVVSCNVSLNTPLFSTNWHQQCRNTPLWNLGTTNRKKREHTNTCSDLSLQSTSNSRWSLNLMSSSFSVQHRVRGCAKNIFDINDDNRHNLHQDKLHHCPML